MKKITLILLLSIFCANISYAQTPVSFVYLNGSNNNSDKNYDNFIKRVGNFHPVLKSALENDDFTYKHMLKNGEYVISNEPTYYFWGYKSHDDLVAMQEKAKLLQSVSPWLAYTFRNMLAGMLHDAIWVRDSSNMMPILDELNALIKKDIADGKKIVLLGYSAGSFITMEYMATKVAYINLHNLISSFEMAYDIMPTIKENPRKNTCASALLHSNIARMNPMGKIEFNPNKDAFVKAYMNIDEQTDTYCVPEDSIAGIINYASPIPLFYSDLSNPKYDTNKLLRHMYKHIIEHDMFFLTVNFADDPLGFPNGINYKNAEISEYLNIDLEKGKGFFYDYSSDLSWRTVICAHTCYWRAKERFVKAILKGYKKGYQFQYENKNK